MIEPSRSLRFTFLGFGFLFLYIPIVSLVVYSFNESQLVTVWTQFSLKWYAALLHDDELINAAWLSIRVAVFTACASVVIGTWAGYVLARMGRFRGFTLYAGMINAPLVIPEVIQGFRCCCCLWKWRKYSAGQPGVAFSRSGSATSCCVSPTSRSLWNRGSGN